MKLIFVLVCLTIFGFRSYGQSNDETEKVKKMSLLFKLKFVPLPLGNDLFLITSIGTDFRFHKNHSIGVLLYRSNINWSQEDLKDTAGISPYEGSVNYAFTLHKNKVVNYRYYFKPALFSKTHSFIFYTGIFLRYGIIVEDDDAEFVKIPKYSKEINYSEGLFFGVLRDFVNEANSKFQNHLGYDFNIGVYSRNSIINSNVTENHVVSYSTQQKWSMGVRVDFGLTFIF
jgi:hypothetical protein